MENINGIQVDVSAVLADKIAEIAVATISTEQLAVVGNKAIYEVTKGGRWDSKPSRAQILATEKFYAEVSKYFDEIMSSEEYQKKAKEEAEKIIEDMKAKIHDNLVNNISGQLSAQYVSPYGEIFTRNVEQIVLGIMQR